METNSAESALLKALEAAPEDWSIRLLIAEKFYVRGADDDATALIRNAPGPPSTAQELEKVIRFSGSRSLSVTQAYVAEHPADPFGHHSLAYLLEIAGETDKAANHYQVARALGFSGTEETPQDAARPDQEEQAPLRPAHPQNDPLLTAPPPASAIEPPQHSGEGLAVSPTGRQTGSRVTAVLIAIGVHVIIALIAAILIVLPPSRSEPEIIASLIAPPPATPEMKKKNVVKQVKRSAASSSAAAPLAQLMRANAQAKISLPEVTKTSIGPLGIGEGDFGAGSFGGTGGDFGSGATLFGGTGGNGLQGRFYDFKRDKNGEPTGIGKDVGLYTKILREFTNGATWKPPGRKYYTSAAILTANTFFFPAMKDTEAGEAFQAKGTGPGFWIAHYSGTIVPDESGKYRLIGWGDNVLAVKIGSTMVLDASDRQSLQGNYDRAKPVSFPGKANTPGFYGEWFTLRAGTAITCDIVLSDQGGIFCAGVHIQKEGDAYKTDKNGIPDLPVLVIGNMSSGQRKLYDKYLNDKHFDGPKFSTRR